MKHVTLNGIRLAGFTIVLGGALVFNPISDTMAFKKKRRPEEVKVVNGPEMPASVQVENQPTVSVGNEPTVNIGNVPEVKIINGPDMPTSVTIENQPTVTVGNEPNINVLNEVNVDVTNNEENPIPVAIQNQTKKEPHKLECIIELTRGLSATQCSYDPIEEGKIFLAKFVTADAFDSSGAGNQYRFIFSLNGQIPFIPPPTVLTFQGNNFGTTVVNERIVSFVPADQFPFFQFTRRNTTGTGNIVTKVYGYLIDDPN